VASTLGTGSLFATLGTLVVLALAALILIQSSSCSSSCIPILRTARRRGRHLRLQQELVDAQLLLVVAPQFQFGDALEDLLPVVVVVGVLDVDAAVASGAVVVQILPAVGVIAEVPGSSCSIPGQLLQGGTQLGGTVP